MVFIIADNIYSPLGKTSEENFNRLTRLESGIRRHENPGKSEQPFFASLFDPAVFNEEDVHTPFEQLLINSISEVLKQNLIDPSDQRTGLIISTTKGNISLIENRDLPEGIHQRVSLHDSAKRIAAHFGFTQPPLVISNACISGLLAMITGMRLIHSGRYDQVVVAGADLISKFILSGFQSFQAVSDQPCKPFDIARAGINLGEGAATVILSRKEMIERSVKLTGGSVSNDANHISGPSRTGEELFQSMHRAMEEAGLTSKDIDLVSAHGTATLYNDEMEAKAINLAGLQEVPVNSLKGYYGHTLGAAGLIETVASVWSMRQGIILPTPGYEQMGVSQPVNVSNQLRRATIRHCLKTASGFGGCNAAITITS
ncbi:MAG: beta-ketoacyl-[acyl-carrier-protein] synthase family protein [Chitinophagaceae bacterium]|nr:beta-ketoacyl-[acyl-carrier-protein] synthase family protein [Chitinophagaceae bacterium]MBL0055116.1 beta-ketoacyl-[acyl-carrier-protein] synthase family protein [Chitinophagaceae bacterium]